MNAEGRESISHDGRWIGYGCVVEGSRTHIDRSRAGGVHLGTDWLLSSEASSQYSRHLSDVPILSSDLLSHRPAHRCALSLTFSDDAADPHTPALSFPNCAACCYTSALTLPDDVAYRYALALSDDHFDSCWGLIGRDRS